MHVYRSFVSSSSRTVVGCLAVRLPLQVRDTLSAAEQRESETGMPGAGVDADAAFADESVRAFMERPGEEDEDGIEQVRLPASRIARRHIRTCTGRL